MTPDLVGGWRKAGRSGGEGGNCVEIRADGWVRDSKNPAGGALRATLTDLVEAVAAGRLTR